MAIKFNPLSKLTTFLGYTYEVGQNGTICPMLHYSPVEFFGTIHTKSSGSSLNRFRELNLKVGDIIKVTYTNDVMPYVTSVDCEQNRKNTNPLCEFPNVCPICGTPLQLSDSGKTAFCSNLNCSGRVIGRMTNMLAKLNIKGFAESTIKTLGISNFATLMEVKYDNIADLIGPTNASNFIMALDHIRNSGIDDYILIGSLGFTGIAAQKWKLVFENYTLSELYTIYREGNILNALGNIKGLGPITAQTIENEFNIFLPDIEYILTKVNFVNSKNKAKGKLQIRFTGCRNLQLQEQLINSGYDCDGNGTVTKKTDILLVPYLGFNSTKLSKVGPNCKIIPIQEFIDNMQKYL
jgi:DNA ligase (NAD+)